MIELLVCRLAPCDTVSSYTEVVGPNDKEYPTTPDVARDAAIAPSGDQDPSSHLEYPHWIVPC
jgi:hypothetical protein